MQIVEQKQLKVRLKLAKYITKRPYVFPLLDGFHGRSLGALSVTTSKSKYRKFMQPSGLTYQIPYANVKGCPQGLILKLT